MEAHICDIKYEIILQDKQSDTRMDKNGKKSCTGNSRHIYIYYFFAKDRVESSKISITYCNTEHIFADLFTKDLNWVLFMKFPEVIMGWKHIVALQMGPPSTNEYNENVDEVEYRK